MKLSEFIEWLKTQPQDADVKVLVETYDICFDGEHEYSCSYVSEESVNYFDQGVRCNYNKKTNTLLIGQRE